MTCWRCGLMVLVLAGGSAAPADDPKAIDAKAFDKAVVDSLREVHHVGRELYNASKDFTATYRVYQGALLAVKPLLAHRPEVQKAIDAGLAAAEKEPEVARKAFMLHEAIEKTRGTLRVPAAEPKIPEAKKPDPPVKKPEEAKELIAVAPLPKVKAPADIAKKPAGGPGFRGTVTLKGKPLSGVEVVLVSLDQPKPRVFSATTQADGQYAPTEAIPAGKYIVMLSGKGVPEKYTTTTTSPLRTEVKQPPNVFDIDLP